MGWLHGSEEAGGRAGAHDVSERSHGDYLRKQIKALEGCMSLSKSVDPEEAIEMSELQCSLAEEEKREAWKIAYRKEEAEKVALVEVKMESAESRLVHLRLDKSSDSEIKGLMKELGLKSVEPLMRLKEKLERKAWVDEVRSQQG